MPGKKILLVPLNWGLGHASRLIPIISHLKYSGENVLVGGSSSHISLIKGEFKEIEVVKIPTLKIRLGGKKFQAIHIILQIPAFLFQIIYEHWALKKIIKQYGIDVVISDNCYGLWNQRVYSVFITHQINIKLPSGIRLLENFLNRINHWFIRKFNECWIPDIEYKGGLAGELSHNTGKISISIYIGLLSRLSYSHSDQKNNHGSSPKKILIIISGPENQRSIFEDKIKDQLKLLLTEIDFKVIRGLPEIKDNDLPKGWFNHLPACQMAESIIQSDYIICRSGYSSIMDLITLGRTALLVPTPGQTEQEYLAEYLTNKKLFIFQRQDELDLKKGLETLDLEREDNERVIRSIQKKCSPNFKMISEQLSSSHQKQYRIP